MRVHYDPISGLTQPDERVEVDYQEYLRLKDQENFCPRIGSMLMLTRLRVGRSEGDIDSLTIIVDNVEYEVRDDGMLPDGFWRNITDHNIEFIIRIMDGPRYRRTNDSQSEDAI